MVKPKITHHVVEAGTEQQIVTAFVVSKKFIDSILPIYHKDFLNNSFAKKICKWCIDYYRLYEEAPGVHIKDIYDIEKDNMDEDETAILEKFLISLSEKYEMQGINEDYYIDKATEYFAKRNLELTSSKIIKLCNMDRIKEAKDEFERYRKIERLTSGWYSPFEEKYIYEVFDEERKGLFRFPGKLGEMWGDFEREWLVAVLGPYKKGKTWLLQEFVIHGILNHLSVAYLQIEMKKVTTNERIYKRVMAAGALDHFIYPIFDCMYNQMGECEKEERINRITLYDEEEGGVPEYDPKLKYRVCAICRGTKDYAMATWFTTLERPEFNYKNTVLKMRAFDKMYGNNLQIKIYPKFSASLSDIQRDLDILERTKDFVPDIIVIDHAGIIRPDKPTGQEYTELDSVWKGLGGLAGERRALVITANQVTTGGLTKKKLEQGDVKGYRGILGHVDMMITLNQTANEKKAKLMNMGLLVHRHKDFNEYENCMVLQQLEVGQAMLDSERYWEKEKGE